MDIQRSDAKAYSSFLTTVHGETFQDCIQTYRGCYGYE